MPYDIVAPTGEQLTGTVWFRSENQIGLTVDAWGDGLLVAGQTPVSETYPTGGEMLVLTSYGRTESEVAEWQGRWTDWWS